MHRLEDIVETFFSSHKEKAWAYLVSKMQADGTLQFPAASESISVDALYEMLHERLEEVSTAKDVVLVDGADSLIDVKVRGGKKPQEMSLSYFQNLAEGTIGVERDRTRDARTVLTTIHKIDTGKPDSVQGLDGIESKRDYTGGHYSGMFGKWNK